MANFLNIAEVLQNLLPSERIFPFLEWPIFSTSPLRGIQKIVKCERIFPLLTWPNLSTSSPSHDAKKWSDVNVFSIYELGKFPRHRHQDAMQYLTDFLVDWLEIMARAARKMCQYIIHFSL